MFYEQIPYLTRVKFLILYLVLKPQNMKIPYFIQLQILLLYLTLL